MVLDWYSNTTIARVHVAERERTPGKVLSDIPLRVFRASSQLRLRPQTEGKLWTPRLERAAASASATDQPTPRSTSRTWVGFGCPSAPVATSVVPG